MLWHQVEPGLPLMYSGFETIRWQFDRRYFYDVRFAIFLCHRMSSIGLSRISRTIVAGSEYYHSHSRMSWIFVNCSYSIQCLLATYLTSTNYPILSQMLLATWATHPIGLSASDITAYQTNNLVMGIQINLRKHPAGRGNSHWQDFVWCGSLLLLLFLCYWSQHFPCSSALSSHTFPLYLHQ